MLKKKEALFCLECATEPIQCSMDEKILTYVVEESLLHKLFLERMPSTLGKPRRGQADEWEMTKKIISTNGVNSCFWFWRWKDKLIYSYLFTLQIFVGIDAR